MADTNIGWTDKVWNPTVGCSRVSPGCENCYAETFANRLEGMGQARYKGLTVVGKHGARWTGEVRQVPEVLAAPLGWRKGRRVFVNSMSDLFHEAVPFKYVAAVFGVMAACPQHTFQVLTKRPSRALEFFEWLNERAAAAGSFPVAICAAQASQQMNRPSDFMPDLVAEWPAWPLQSVHLGVSVEDQVRADERIPLLLKCPAAVRWISAEPLLGPITLHNLKSVASLSVTTSDCRRPDALTGSSSGVKAGLVTDSCEPSWIDSIVEQARRAGDLPIFVKQDSGPKRPGARRRGAKESRQRGGSAWADEALAAKKALSPPDRLR
jgi:protein gp37